MTQNSSLQKLWQAEYQKKGIPSSFRKDPTKVVLEFVAKLEKKQGVALDVGCGLGRNSFYLAEQGFQVKAMDLLADNCNSVNREAIARKLPIQAFAQNASETWPFDSDFFDIAIDVFCYKHIVNKKEQTNYRKEL